MVALLIILGMSRLEGRVTHSRQLIAPGTLSLLIAIAFLGAAAAFRWSITGV